LPLRGKILNSEGLALNKVLANAELNDLVSAIGTGAGEKFDLNGLRYGKIILLMDADADGHHITTLLLAFFFRHMTELIRKGRVYLAQPPLYRIDVGKETFWARDDAHKEEILAGLRANAKSEVSRFKGLGEMDPKVLAETTLDVRHRTLLQVQIAGANRLQPGNRPHLCRSSGQGSIAALSLHHGQGGAGRGRRAGCLRRPQRKDVFLLLHNQAVGSEDSLCSQRHSFALHQSIACLAVSAANRPSRKSGKGTFFLYFL
jgi:hypothetical protein